MSHTRHTRPAALPAIRAPARPSALPASLVLHTTHPTYTPCCLRCALSYSQAGKREKTA